jgi:hypothetical protein
MSTEAFYSKLHSFSDFATLGDDRHYETLPADWFVVITDVRGSTKAIEEGRYQDVNTLGAASVAVLGQLWKDNAVPFVFGGDGASMLVPPSRLDVVKRELVRLRNLALANYNLELRVGVVPMSEIAAKGLKIEVAKFASGSAKPIAFIRGGGLSWADTVIKANSEKYGIVDLEAGVLGEVKDLSCRWQPLKSQKGKVVTLLARSTTNDITIYASILEKMALILGGDVQISSPVSQLNMKYKSMFSILQSEKRQYFPVLQKSFFQQVLVMLLCVWEFSYGYGLSLFDSATYRKKIPSHSDYRKFDDMLRLVLDCSSEQITRIQALLEELHRSGIIYYGLHISDYAIMTCLVGSISEGDHIHFIDGGDGGYSLAAMSLKQQISAANV